MDSLMNEVPNCIKGQSYNMGKRVLAKLSKKSKPRNGKVIQEMVQQQVDHGIDEDRSAFDDMTIMSQESGNSSSLPPQSRSSFRNGNLDSNEEPPVWVMNSPTGRGREERVCWNDVSQRQRVFVFDGVFA
ncbi:unnamed protein product [Cylindrotheca closterium]|uniref:Uncharacterized protein n=1 Tax=Cylindrotheca closterium TaxID=2856 RepID=A0AAD2JGK6_9STRA|nr:unnamed protein product [Cylindrotheca closterium]